MMWLAAQKMQWQVVGKDDQCTLQHVQLPQGAPAGSPLTNCCLAVLVVAQGCRPHAIRASTDQIRQCSGSHRAWQAL